MFAPRYFPRIFFWEQYFSPVITVIIIQDYAGAYAIIHVERPSTPIVIIDGFRGVTTLLAPLSDIDSREDDNVTQGFKTANISGGVSPSTIERVQ